MTALVEHQSQEENKKKFSLKKLGLKKSNKDENVSESETKEEKLARKQAKKEEKKREKEQKKQAKKSNDRTPVDTDDSSNASGASSLRNIFGLEKKKPRAEYQAEIDELKYQLDMANTNLSRATSQLQQAQHKLNRFENWARSAPFN
jgi:mannitol-specific phosphotransferase system IIBC component